MDLLSVRIAAEPDIARIRQVTGVIADTCGLASFAKTRVVTAVLEIARNALQYDGGGRAHFAIRPETDLCWLVVRVIDHGRACPKARISQDADPSRLNLAALRKGWARSTGVRASRPFDTTPQKTGRERNWRRKPSASEEVELRVMASIAELSSTDPLPNCRGRTANWPKPWPNANC